jgi:hypothetical protein
MLIKLNYLFSKNKYYIYSILLLIHLSIIIINKLIKTILDVESKFETSMSEEDLYRNFISYLIVIGVIIPILEETAFRLWLTKSHKVLLFSIFIFIFLMTLNSSNWIFTLVIIISHLFTVILWIKIKSIEKKFTIVLILNATIFSIMHLDNYLNFELFKHIFYIPFLLLPQFALGIITFLLRTQIGFIHAINYHILYNLILLIYGFTENKIVINNL